MKKRAAQIAAALLMVSSLTGCFGNDDTVSSEAGTSETHTEESVVTERTSEDRNDDIMTEEDGVVDNIVTDAGDIVSDVADGAEDIVDDITGSDVTSSATETVTTTN